MGIHINPQRYEVYEINVRGIQYVGSFMIYQPWPLTVLQNDEREREDENSRESVLYIILSLM